MADNRFIGISGRPSLMSYWLSFVTAVLVTNSSASGKMVRRRWSLTPRNLSKDSRLWCPRRVLIKSGTTAFWLLRRRSANLWFLVVYARTQNPQPRIIAGNYCWAELMKRAFEIDVLECPHCAGPMRFIPCIMERDVIKAILGSMGMPTDSPAPLSSLPIPQLDFEFEEDPNWEAA